MSKLGGVLLQLLQQVLPQKTATSATKRKLLQPRHFKSEGILKQLDATQSKMLKCGKVPLHHLPSDASLDPFLDTL